MHTEAPVAPGIDRARPCIVHQTGSTTEQPIRSYDVFDTVLTRSVSPPAAVFHFTALHVSDVLPSGINEYQFTLLREEAERRAEKWHGNGVTLQHIYDELQQSLGLTRDCASHIMDAELAIEREIIYPVPETRRVINEWRQNGGKVVFISDMYMPSSFIKERLIEHRIWHPEDLLYVSCEHDACKWDGVLFAHVMKDLPEARKTILHVGNSLSADIKGARRAGIRSNHFTEANPNRYERILERYGHQTGGLSTVLAGASRYARLHTPVKTVHERALCRGAAGVMAPVLSGFVLWILQQVQRQKIQRLYFTARDGQVLIDIARRIAPLLNVDCEMRYVYFSRVAMGGIQKATDQVEWLWTDPAPAGGKELISRLGLQIEEILPYLESERDIQEVMKCPITNKGRELLIEAIQRMVDAGQQQETIIQRRKLLLQYVKQEGFLDDVTAGFVDVGWHGSVHALLNEVLLDENYRDSPIPGYFFGLNPRQRAYSEHRSAYFFDKYRNQGYGSSLPGSSIYTLLEMFCTADHGTVTGYEADTNFVRPVLEPTWTAKMEKWGLGTIRSTIDAFLESLEKNHALLDADVDLRAALTEGLSAFWLDPQPDEASAWGAFPRELGQGTETYVAPLAKGYTRRELLSFIRYGEQTHRRIRHALSWKQGCLLRTPPRRRRTIQRIIRGRRIMHRYKKKLIGLLNSRIIGH